MLSRNLFQRKELFYKYNSKHSVYNNFNTKGQLNIINHLIIDEADMDNTYWVNGQQRRSTHSTAIKIPRLNR